MFTTGSKLLIGSSVIAALAAVLYGVTQKGTLGTIGLCSAAIALTFLATINVFVRDSNVSAMDIDAHRSAPAARPAPAASLWPLAAGLGATMVTVGVVTFPAITILGLIVLLAATAEWMVQAWSERASADQAYNTVVRERIAEPLEVPIIGAVGVAVIIYSISRVMLGLPSKSGAVVAFVVLAALVLLIGTLTSVRRRLSTGTVAGLCSIAVVAVIASGAAYGINGERETHHHETTGAIAEDGDCGAEETEADEDASQSVSAKSNVAATITLTDDGQLTYTVPGFDGGSASLTLPRSTANNVLFRNESAEHRRLSIDTAGAAATADRRVVCTALVDDGGVQMLTVRFDKPGFAVENGYQFTVPGVDDALLPVVVP
jgi:hypothetical protein